MRKIWTLVPTAAVVALVAAALLAGAGQASRQASPPANKSLPTITGTAEDGQTLTGHAGDWTGDQPLTYKWEWQRCGPAGNNCAVVTRVKDNTYGVARADVGNTIRVRVTATNSAGSSSALSQPTEVVKAKNTPPPVPTGPAGAIKLPNGQTSIPVTSVSLPQRLIISGVSYSQNPVRSRDPFTATVHVTDTRGYVVRDTLVYVLGVPYNRIANAPEVATDMNGDAQVTLHPLAGLPLQNGNYLVTFVRARKPGDDLLAGVSTRRLVQVSLAHP